MAAARKDWKKIEKKLVEQGWTIRPTKGGHLQCLAPDPKDGIVTVEGTPSDHRDLANTIARLRRAGADI